MCEPITIMTAIGTGLSIAGTVADAIGKGQRSAANEQSAKDAKRLELVALGKREAQEQQAAAQTIMQVDRQARHADAIARVSAGEAGVAGASVDMILGDIERQRLEAETSISRGAAATVDQIELEKRGADARMKNRINEVPGADPLTTGLRITGHLAEFGANYASRLPQIKKG